jgi:hypothetical protein
MRVVPSAFRIYTTPENCKGKYVIWRFGITIWGMNECIAPATRPPSGGAAMSPAPSRRGLLEEYVRAMRHMTFADARELISLGVPVAAIALTCPAPIRASLTTDGDGGDLYWPDDAGGRVWVLPAHAVDPESPEAIESVDPAAGVCSGAIVDLVAISPFTPDCWARRLGVAEMLGSIRPQCFEPDPVPVHRDVVSWLRAGCSGITLLTRDPHSGGRVLRQIEHIEAEDDQHAAELRWLLALPAPVHSVVMVRGRNEWRRRQPLG